MQNIVKIIEGENHLVIVLRDVTSNQYTAQAYRKQHNGEFTRVGQLARTESPAYAENVGRAWMQNDSLIVLANR